MKMSFDEPHVPIMVSFNDPPAIMISTDDTLVPMMVSFDDTRCTYGDWVNDPLYPGNFYACNSCSRLCLLISLFQDPVEHYFICFKALRWQLCCEAQHGGSLVSMFKTISIYIHC